LKKPLMMTKEELVASASAMTGGPIADLPLDSLRRLMTVTQHVTELSINELERRGELSFFMGAPAIPYDCEYQVETVLNRHGPPEELLQ
jgi:hypothetical protein